jgi:hypothetical protein
MKYLPVSVYRCADGVDCTAGGVTSQVDRVLIPCTEGFITEEEAANWVVLELRDRPFASAAPALKPRGEERWCMFGGNFVYSSDSRFSRMFQGQPVAVHDRIEG